MLVQNPAWQDSTTDYWKQRKGRAEHRWIARRQPAPKGLRADTAVSIEREVVSGHAYAILAPATLKQGRCGYDKPTIRR